MIGKVSEENGPVKILGSTQAKTGTGTLAMTKLAVLWKQEALQLVGQAKRRASKIRLKAVGGGISAVCSNSNKCRPAVTDDVISRVAVD